MAKIYQREIEDGLEPLFKDGLSVAFCATAAKDVGKVKSVSKIVGKLNEDDFIYEYPSILVTAGVWNKNDQIFDKFEVWKAKYTPLNKPGNLNHQPSKVVSHTNRVFAITDEEEAKLIPDTVDGKPNSDIPDIYHLLTVDTFYKYNIKPYQGVDAEYAKKIDEIYKEIVSGELKVSMECIFADFDYGILFPDGSQKIIERNEYTSFLTKKLRRFGGSGEYEGAKIGLLMRDIMFTGKGITDNPANEASVIFSKDSLAFASQNYSKIEDIFNKQKDSAYISSVNGEQKMKLEEALAKITELETALTASKTELAEATKAKTEIESLKTELEKVKTELASHAQKVEVATKEKNELTEKVTQLEKNGKEIETALASANTELAKTKTEKTKIERVQKIKETLGLSQSDSESNYLVTATLDDKAFDNWLTNTKKIVDEKVKTSGTNEQDLAKAKKELEDKVAKENEKSAKDQLEQAEIEKAKLATANVEAEAGANKLKAVKSMFSRNKKD